MTSAKPSTPPEQEIVDLLTDAGHLADALERIGNPDGKISVRCVRALGQAISALVYEARDRQCALILDRRGDA